MMSRPSGLGATTVDSKSGSQLASSAKMAEVRILMAAWPGSKT